MPFLIVNATTLARVERKIDALTTALAALTDAIGKDFSKIMAEIDVITTDQQAETVAIQNLTAAVGVVGEAMKKELTLLADANSMIAALQTQISNGVAVTPQQLTDLDAKIKGNTDTINGQVAALLAIVPAAAPDGPPTQTP